MSKRETRSRLTTSGKPACGDGCRWPRGECPTHRREPMVAHDQAVIVHGEGQVTLFLNGVPQVGRTDYGNCFQPDHACEGCGYHVCACQRATFRHPEAPAPFAVGDLVWKVISSPDIPGGPNLPLGYVGLVTRSGVWASAAGERIPFVAFRDTPRGQSFRATSFIHVAADAVPPGWTPLSPANCDDFHDAPRWGFDTATCWEVDPDIRVACPPGEAFYSRSAQTPVWLASAPSMHEAMRMARGLEHVEDLWAVPTGAADDVGR